MTEQLLEWLPRRLLEHVSDAVVVTDDQLDPPSPHIVDANDAWERLTGCKLSDALGQTPAFLESGCSADTQRISLERLRQCLEDGRGFDAEVDVGSGGTRGRMDWRVEPISDPTGMSAGFAFVARRTGAESRTDTTNAFHVIHELRDLLKGQPLDLARKRQQVARTAMHLSGAEAGVVEQAEGTEMVYQAVAGAAEGLEATRLPIQGSASGYCHTSGEALLIADTRTDSRTQLGAQAADIGFRSGVLVPLVHGDQRFGVLKVFSSKWAAFGQAERDFVVILAGLLAAVMYRTRSYELEAGRRRHLVDALPMLVAYVDADRRYREVNAAYADWFGQPISEVLGKSVWELIGESAYERIRPYMDRALETGEPVSYEETVTFPNDHPTVISVDYAPNVASDGSVAGVYALVRDVTKAKAADLDHLTELPNRRRFEEEAHRQIEVHRRHGRPLSLIIADIDHLKWWNDTQGHLIGDRIIKQIAELLRGQARATDLVARWGGEEFVILAPETDLDGAATLAERVRAQLASEPQPEGEAATLSLGVAEAHGDDLSLRGLIRAADDALYAAKDAGRNRVV